MALLLCCGLAVGAEPAGSPAGTGDLHPQDAGVPTGRSSVSDDLAVTTQIRGALAADTSLSTAARQIQVVTNAEAVILRGAVRTQEPDKIETEVRQYAGTRQIVNQLTVDERQ
jgi:osmotically-inducible protein OsmY